MYKDLQPGDIIGVKRLFYSHYGVYLGNNKVIHYAGRKGDFNGEKIIHQTSMKHFLKGKKKFFELVFPETHDKPGKEERYETANNVYCIYSPKETVERAKSRLGENKYNLAFNNCEHFAIWCKTGISESYQVKAVLKSVVNIVEKIYEI